MNLREAREKLEIMMGIKSRSYDDALCDIIKFLFDELEKIKSPPTAVLEQLLDDIVPRTPLPPIGSPPGPPPDEPVRDYPSQPHKSPPICDPIRKHRKDQNNAGDAT